MFIAHPCAAFDDIVAPPLHLSTMGRGLNASARSHDTSRPCVGWPTLGERPRSVGVEAGASAGAWAFATDKASLYDRGRGQRLG